MTSGFDEQRRNDATQLGQQVPQQFPGQQGYQQPAFTQPPGQPPGYGPPQYPPYGGGQPPKKNTAVIVLVSLAVVVALVGAVVTIVLLNNNSDDSGSTAAGTSTAASSSASTSTSAEPDDEETTTRRSSAVPAPPASIPGYRVITAEKYNAAYDVPSGWSASSASAPTSVGASGAAVDGVNYCPGSSARNVSYMVTQKTADTAAAAAAAGKDAARLGYSSTSPESRAATPFQSSNGRIKGSFMEFFGPWKPKEEGCQANRFSVYVFAVSLQKGDSGVLVIMADRGMSGDLDENAAKKILGSLRSISS